MPIHLRPLSRREFLALTVTGAAGLAAGCRALRPSRADPHRFALLADTHIAADPALIVRNTNMTANLRRVAEELARLEVPPADVFINGDCAYLKGELADYQALVGLLQALRRQGPPIHLLLGNHDHRENFRKTVRQVAPVTTAVPDRHVAWARSPRANWFLLDSLDATNSTPGLLGDAQLAWLAKALDANADRPAVVVGHHNFEKGEVRSGLKDGQKLLELMESRRHVKAYIYGHTHRWNREQTESGLHVINLPPVAYPFEAARPSGWVDARLATDGLRLELRCVDAAHQQHGEVAELKWRAG